MHDKIAWARDKRCSRIKSPRFSRRRSGSRVRLLPTISDRQLGVVSTQDVMNEGIDATRIPSSRGDLLAYDIRIGSS